MHVIPPQAAGRHGVFSLREATRCGWTQDALDHAVRTGRLERLRPGAYRESQAPPEDVWRARTRSLTAAAIAAALTNPSGTISHGSAALLHGVAMLHAPERPCVTVLPGFVGDTAGVHLHRAALPAPSTERCQGIALTTVDRTVIDIGREYGLEAGLVAADSALNAGLTSLPHLHAALVSDGRGSDRPVGPYSYPTVEPNHRWNHSVDSVWPAFCPHRNCRPPSTPEAPF